MAQNFYRRNGIAGIPGRNLNSVRGALDISGLYPVKLQMGGDPEGERLSQAAIEAEMRRTAPQNLPGLTPTLDELGAAQGILSTYLGDSGYAAERETAQSNARLQAYLALAEAGFGSMGAQPGEGESPMSVMGRAFAAPLAGRMSTIAGTFAEQDAARRAAQRAEERAIKLQALEDVKSSKQAAREQYQDSWNDAVERIKELGLKDAEISDKYTVDGARVPVIIQTDSRGKVTILDTNGNKIPIDALGIYSESPDWTYRLKQLQDITVLLGEGDDKQRVTGTGSIAFGINDYGDTKAFTATAIEGTDDAGNPVMIPQGTPVPAFSKDVQPEGVNSFVNTGSEPRIINEREVGVGQFILLTPSQLDAAIKSDPDLATSLQETGPADMSAKMYTLREDRVINDVQYAAGDQIPLNGAQLDALDPETQKILSDDDTINRTDLKLRGFEALWKNVSEVEGLPLRKPSEQELESLLTMFPAGMRSGGTNLRSEIFRLIKFGPPPEGVIPEGAIPEGVIQAQDRAENYKDAVTKQLEAARVRYEEYVSRDVLGERSWNSIPFEQQMAFADLPKVMQLGTVEDQWLASQTRMAADRERYSHPTTEDIAAYSAGIELLHLAKYLRDSGDLSATGRWFGWFSNLRTNVFSDVEPLTSAPSERLRQIINRMKASYATLAAGEGEGRPSNVRLALQQGLIPSFTRTEKLNERNLDTMISRLETNLRSVFDPAVLTTTVIPQSFEVMARDAGITNFGEVDPTRYRWMDPRIEAPPPVTRQRVMETIGLKLRGWGDLAALRVGRIIESNEGVLFVKIKDTTDGSVVIQEADLKGYPKEGSEPITITEEIFNSGWKGTAND